MDCINDNSNIINIQSYENIEIRQIHGVICVLIGTLLKYSNDKSINEILSKKELIDMISSRIGLDSYNNFIYIVLQKK